MIGDRGRSSKVNEWGGPDGDVSDVLVPPPAANAEPERRLAFDMLTMALEDIQSRGRTVRQCRHRRQARAWLRDDGRVLSARLCCEALGVDYDLLRAKLEAAWR
jgi:hypothetical protein